MTDALQTQQMSIKVFQQARNKSVTKLQRLVNFLQFYFMVTENDNYLYYLINK